MLFQSTRFFSSSPSGPGHHSTNRVVSASTKQSTYICEIDCHQTSISINTLSKLIATRLKGPPRHGTTRPTQRIPHIITSIMSAPRATKRARANSIGDRHVEQDQTDLSGESRPFPTPEQDEPIEIRDKIKQLDQRAITTILIAAAKKYPDINARIENTIQRKRENERKRILTFDKVPAQVWRLATTTTRMDRYEQEAKAFQTVSPKNEGKIADIAEQCSETLNPATRFNGLSALRYIGERICRCRTDFLGRFVRQNFRYSSVLEDSMMEVLRAMTSEERMEIRDGELDPESLWSKLVALDSWRQGQLVFNKCWALWMGRRLLIYMSWNGRKWEKG